jgi:hypothetical protein
LVRTFANRHSARLPEYQRVRRLGFRIYDVSQWKGKSAASIGTWQTVLIVEIKLSVDRCVRPNICRRLISARRVLSFRLCISNRPCKIYNNVKIREFPNLKLFTARRNIKKCQQLQHRQWKLT